MIPERPDEGEAAGASPLAMRIVGGIAFAGGVVSALIVLVSLATVTVAVCFRYVLGAPLLWGDEFVGLLVVAMIMTGAAEALRRGDHISIDLLTGRLRGPARRLVQLWSMLAVAAFSAVLGWSAWQGLIFARAFGAYTSGYLAMPLWIAQTPLVLGAALLGLVAIARFVELLVAPRRR